MKQCRLHLLTMAVMLFLLAGLASAQDAAPQPSAGANFDYNRDRLQYEGASLLLDMETAQAAPTAQESISSFLPPAEALMPCSVEITAATICDMIATQPEDIVGVWTLYFQSQPAFIRFNLDATWVLGNSVESTSDLGSAYASGSYSFDDAGVFTSVFIGAPLDVVPQACQAGRYILRVLKVEGEPVALDHAVIEDCFVNRETDWRYTMLRVSAE